MDEIGLRVPSRDLEVCRMSNEALPDEEVAARVRAAVSGDFQPEHVNGFPMKPKKDYYDLVSLLSHCCLPPIFGFDFSKIYVRFAWGAIDARSSKPLVKEDDVEREKRRASAEKHKFVQDAEKKKEKRKNLE